MTGEGHGWDQETVILKARWNSGLALDIEHNYRVFYAKYYYWSLGCAQLRVDFGICFVSTVRLCLMCHHVINIDIAVQIQVLPG